ncbi:MAG: amidohydrolase family protein, partial [Paracoccaceae bacterium]|nr:amidohydrolase family protein [Paracoccaceae bacterium]
MSGITVFQAAKIITMDPNRPTATHVAVRDGHVLAVGDATCADQWGRVHHDDRLAGTVLMPGFVEGHSHMSETCFWDYTYVGFHDRIDPDGQPWPGLTEIGAVLARLRDAAARLGPDEPLIAWGFDPIYFKDRRCVRADLDRVSKTRLIAMMPASGHIIITNSAGLKTGDWLRTGVEHPGIPLGDDGIPTGELKGPEAMQPVMGKTPLDRGFLGAAFGGHPVQRA